MSLTWDRYQAAADPVDLEKLKISEEEQEDVAMEDVAEDEEDEEDEDAALEDIKDLFDDDEGTGKKRKRPAADDGEDQKTGRKKVRYLTKVSIDCRNWPWLYNKRKNVNLINLNKTVLQNAKKPVPNPKINRFPKLTSRVDCRLKLRRRNLERRKLLTIIRRRSCTSDTEFKEVSSIKVEKNLIPM